MSDNDAVPCPLRPLRGHLPFAGSAKGRNASDCVIHQLRRRGACPRSGPPGLVLPEQTHRVEPIGRMRMQVDFYDRPPDLDANG
jgi:hypothetical protein